MIHFGNGHGQRCIQHQLAARRKIILGGAFTFCRAVARNHIARLNADGTLDTTFNPGTGTDGAVGTAVQSNGKIIIGGFVMYNGTARRYIAHLNADGSLDTSSNLGTDADHKVFATQALMSFLP